MAVKVVQGLIAPSTSLVDSRPIKAASAVSSQMVYAQRVATSAAGQVATQSAATNAEAAVNKLRAHSASRKRETIRSLEEALGLAEQVTLSLVTEEEGAGKAHADLTPDETRAYLM
jgi:hypothetical protein